MNIGRKAQMAWASFVMTNIHFSLSALDQGAYITLTTLIFGLYAGANVIGKSK